MSAARQQAILPPGAACADDRTGLDLTELAAGRRIPGGMYRTDRGVDRDWHSDLATARDLCQGCPVLADCLVMLETSEVDGFAAGMTKADRRGWRSAYKHRVHTFDPREVLPPGIAHADAPRAPITAITVVAVRSMRAKGYERADIAAALSIPERTVRSAISNARRARAR